MDSNGNADGIPSLIVAEMQEKPIELNSREEGEVVHGGIEVSNSDSDLNDLYE